MPVLSYFIVCFVVVVVVFYLVARFVWRLWKIDAAGGGGADDVMFSSFLFLFITL